MAILLPSVTTVPRHDLHGMIAAGYLHAFRVSVAEGSFSLPSRGKNILFVQVMQGKL